MDADHNIWIGGSAEPGRVYWECSCGRSGSVPQNRDVDTAAEKHIGDGETVTYTNQEP